MRQGADRPFIRIRHVAMEVVMESASLKSVKIIISRTSLQERTRAAVFHELMEDTSVQHSSTNSRKQMCGVQGIRYVVKKKRSTDGRRVEERVLGDAGYAGLEVCHQSYYCLELDTIRADEINTCGRPRG